MKRRKLCEYGQRGDRVKAVVDTDAIVAYYRGPTGKQHTRHFPLGRVGEKLAREWCADFHAARKRQAEEAVAKAQAKTTHAQLWALYTASPAWIGHRAATRANYVTHWRRWEKFRGSETPVDDTTLAHVDDFITEYHALVAINQVRQTLTVARIVMNWGTSRKHVKVNELAVYRWHTPDGAVEHEPDEYTPEEMAKLRAWASPQDNRRWRLSVALVLGGVHGQRARAVLNLKKADIVAGEIVWPAEFQKQRKEHRQPLTWDAVAALETARWWTERATTHKQNHVQRERREALALSPYVLPSHGHPDRPWSYNGMYKALMAAEVASGVTHKPWRAFHGGRRGSAGTVADATQDARLGMEWVGDRDLKQAKSYLKRRNERMDRAAEAATGEKA